MDPPSGDSSPDPRTGQNAILCKCGRRAARGTFGSSMRMRVLACERGEEGGNRGKLKRKSLYLPPPHFCRAACTCGVWTARGKRERKTMGDTPKEKERARRGGVQCFLRGSVPLWQRIVIVHVPLPPSLSPPSLAPSLSPSTAPPARTQFLSSL